MLNFIVRLLTEERYRRWRFSFSFILYFLMIGVGSIPDARQDIGEVASGFVLHALAYGTITFFLFTGLDFALLRRALCTFLIVALMGALDEVIQSFFPYRRGAIQDWYVDVSACIFMLTILVTTSMWRSANSAKPVRQKN
jgi:hypothetical protein